MNQKGRRRVLRDLLVDREVMPRLVVRFVSEQGAARGAVGKRVLHRNHRKHQHEEVGASADPIERRSGAPLGRVEQRAGGRREMAAGRAAEQADALRLHAPLRRPRPHRPDGTQRIAQRSGMAVFNSPVFEHEDGDPESIQPARDLAALRPHGNADVAATGRVNHRRAVGRACRRRIDRQRRAVDVREPTVAVVLLGAGVGLEVRHAFGPEVDHGGGLNGKDRGGQVREE